MGKVYVAKVSNYLGREAQIVIQANGIVMSDARPKTQNPKPFDFLTLHYSGFENMPL